MGVFWVLEWIPVSALKWIKSHWKDELGAVFITRELVRLIHGVLEPHMRCRQTSLCSLGLLPLAESLKIDKGCSESLLLTTMKRFYRVGEDLFQNNNAFLSILVFVYTGDWTRFWDNMSWKVFILLDNKWQHTRSWGKNIPYVVLFQQEITISLLLKILQQIFLGGSSYLCLLPIAVRLKVPDFITV